MHIGVVGINHKLADLKLREMLAKICQRRFGPSESTPSGHNFILLSTCNRTEVYFCSNDLAASHSYLLGILRHDVQEEFDQKLYSYFGKDCFLHLCRVTAGLDSAVVAETEIQGQVKNAYEAALEYRHLPPELHYLFQKSLSIAKKIRTALPSKPGLPDVEHAIYCTGQHFFNHSKQAKILFVGASDINEKILAYLKIKNLENISLCNRSPEAASSLCSKYQINCTQWNEIHSWHHYDWIIFGTKAPERLLSLENLPLTPCSPKLVIDLSVPRNVDPSLGKNPHITLLNIDQINRRLKVRKKHMTDTLSQAENMVTQSVLQYIRLFKEKSNNRRLRLIA